MEMNDFFYPEIEAVIGGYSFTRGIEIEVYSSQDSYFDWGKISFLEQFDNEVTINKGDEAIIKLGYNDKLEPVFKGYAKDSVNAGGTSQNQLLLKDKMLKLEQSMITNTFLDATPQEVLRYCLHKAGITRMKLSTRVYPKKNIMPIFKKNVISTIQEMHNLWRIKEPFFFMDGIFYWGVKPEQAQTYSFEYAQNIIDLNLVDGLWELETISAPFIKHSHKIKVTHPRIAGVFEVSKTVFSTTSDGFVRSKIYFKG